MPQLSSAPAPASMRSPAARVARVRPLKAEGRARRHEGWACYHTDLYVFEQGGMTFGVVGCAVGSSFAVLVAEQLFASGCTLLISVTSAGQITQGHWTLDLERVLSAKNHR